MAETPTKVIDIPAALGEYMLKGWVMMNQACTTPGCPVPLLRSPTNMLPVKKFCVKCDGSPDNIRSPVSEETLSSLSAASHVTRTSTPPTPLSDTSQTDEFLPPVETESSRRRREQSDLASSRIAELLLLNWTLLGEDCPNPQCFGIPLMRPPRSSGIKQCVVCQTSYLTRPDGVLVSNPAEEMHTSGAQGLEMQQTVTPGPPQVAPHRSNAPSPTSSVSAYLSRIDEILTAVQVPATPEVHEAESALKLAMRTLSTRLNTLSSSLLTVDPSSIGQTAESLGKVAASLSQVRELHQRCGHYA